MASNKRRREGYEERASVRREARIRKFIDDAESVRNEIEAVYGVLEDKCLWDANSVWTLVQPTLYFDPESQKWYRYVGRRRSKQLYEAFLNLQPREGLQVQGAKGSGKSTAVCSIVGLMCAKNIHQVVYINAGRLLDSPVGVLRHALLVASGDDDLAEMDSLEELVDWCEGHLEPLLFVVDDWDKFEGASTDTEARIKQASLSHILVKVSSANSRTRQLCSATDKPPPTFNFDGPFTRNELKTWIAQSSLEVKSLQDLDKFTGGMPGLLRLYEEVQGKATAFTKKMEEPYTLKLLYKFIGIQNNKVELRAALDLVTTGNRSPWQREPLDLRCFYVDKDTELKILSPYLRRKAEAYIMDRQSTLDSALELSDIKKWAAAVRLDCSSKGRNPARVGWNVEGLVIGVMRYQHKVWAGLDFKHHRIYKHGDEEAALKALDQEQLTEGVFLEPEAFNEKAVDAIYLILVGTVLKLIALQITVSSWKAKARKMSHVVWRQEVVPKLAWGSWRRTLLQQYVYVMPESVKPEDVELEAGAESKSEQSQMPETVKPKDVELEAGAQNNSEQSQTDDEDEDEENDEGNGGICFVDAPEGVLFKKLKDVHTCLADFDKLLNLRKPVELEKLKLENCAGKVKDKATGEWRPCKNMSRTKDTPYFCCQSHRMQHEAKNGEDCGEASQNMSV